MTTVVATFSAGARGRLANVRRHLEQLRSSRAVVHWYLSLLGVEPAQQGRGLGSQLLRPVLSRADEERVECFLFPENATNVPFYQRHGFAVDAEGNLPDDGPRFWMMKRAPRPPSAG